MQWIFIVLRFYTYTITISQLILVLYSSVSQLLVNCISANAGLQLYRAASRRLFPDCLLWNSMEFWKSCVNHELVCAFENCQCCGELCYIGVHLAVFADDTCLYAKIARKVLLLENFSTVSAQWRLGVSERISKLKEIRLRGSTSLAVIHLCLILHWMKDIFYLKTV
jgi:hypothetical protein